MPLSMENKGLNKRAGKMHPLITSRALMLEGGKKEVHRKLACRRISKHYRPNDTENGKKYYKMEEITMRNFRGFVT